MDKLVFHISHESASRLTQTLFNKKGSFTDAEKRLVDWLLDERGLI